VGVAAYEVGQIVLTVICLAFTAPPGGGDHVLKAALSYQACGEGICHPPEVVRLELP